MSSLGFPEELNFQTLKSMYPSRKTEYRKAPMNSQTFNVAGQDIQLVLSKMENSFYDPNTLCVNFTVDYGVTTGVPADNAAFLLGYAYSHFSRQVVRPLSGTPIETIDNPSLLANAVLNMTMDSNEKSALSTTMGFNDGNIHTNFGAQISNSNNLKVQSFSIPLIGCLNTAKFIPAFISDIEIDLTLNNFSNFIVDVNVLAAGTNPVTPSSAITGYTIKNVEIVCEVITLEESGMQQILAMFPGQIKLKSQSYLYGSSTLSGISDATTQDITYSHSLNSLKSFIWWSSPANALGKNYAGVCPNLSSWQLLIGSTAYPQQLVKSTRPSECFMQNQKAFGSLYSTSHCGSASKIQFARASTAADEYAAYQQTQGATVSIADTLKLPSNKWYQALDLEIINNLKETLYTGISTKGSTNTLRLNIARALATQSHAVHFFSCFDVILEFDYANQMINVIQ
jgi:hypothetical protein